MPGVVLSINLKSSDLVQILLLLILETKNINKGLCGTLPIVLLLLNLLHFLIFSSYLFSHLFILLLQPLSLTFSLFHYLFASLYVPLNSFPDFPINLSLFLPPFIQHFHIVVLLLLEEMRIVLSFIFCLLIFFFI